MARCPLCEHEQERGAACDVCGRLLPAAEVVHVRVVPIEGLEETGYGPVAVPVAAPEPWLEATLQARVTVEVAPLEVERTARDGERLGESGGLRTCRSCREIVPTGEAFCLRCGMSVGRRASAPAAAEPRARRCRQCGTWDEGARCPGCGARLPEPG